MKDLVQQADEIPVTLVVAVAYGTLAVVTGMLGPAEAFAERVDTFGLLRPLQVAAGEPWRLLASTFLHLNLIHLLVNLMSLVAIGPALERSLGSLRFAALYLLSGLGGSLAVCLVYDPRQPVAGGSGALFGMMGALVALNMRAGRHLFAFLEFEGPRRLLGLIAFNFVLGWLIPVISNTAHAGGLVAGFLVTFLWLRPGAATPARRQWRLAVGALFVVWTAWSIVPVTRFDWLARAAEATTHGGRRVALLRAAATAYGAVRLEDLVPEPAPTDPPRRGR